VFHKIRINATFIMLLIPEIIILYNSVPLWRSVVKLVFHYSLSDFYANYYFRTASEFSITSVAAGILQMAELLAAKFHHQRI